MNDINLIDSCPLAHAIRFEHQTHSPRGDIGVVIDSEPRPSHRCETSFLFAPLAVCDHAGCSAFLFYTVTKQLIQ